MVKIIGEYTYIDPSVEFVGVEKFVIGDGAYVGPGCRFVGGTIEIGDYAKIHDNMLIYGGGSCKIGHNFWVGRNCIVDTLGDIEIGNNCGIGADSQLWTHIQYGDELEGCRFKSKKKMIIGNDCWFVGHCVVSPIVAKDRSMAMVGSVITRDMEENHVYAGVPAKDMTAKFGGQFSDVSVEDKRIKMEEYLAEFACNNPVHAKMIRIISSPDERQAEKWVSYFDVSTRTYNKTNTPSEHAFMKFLLPTKAKFTPLEQE